MYPYTINDESMEGPKFGEFGELWYLVKLYSPTCSKYYRLLVYGLIHAPLHLRILNPRLNLVLS